MGTRACPLTDRFWDGNVAKAVRLYAKGRSCDFFTVCCSLSAR
jgi:hypothetical protein